MINYKNLLIFLTLTLIIMSSDAYSAKPAGSLAGKIINDVTGEPIIGATVRLEGTSIGSYTNKDGNFLFKSIPQGNYKLLISYIGFEVKKIEILIKENERTALEIPLREKVLLSQEVVVTANKKIQAVQDVPVSLSLISGKIFSEKTITRLDQALNYVSGVEVNNDNISIRGSSGFAFGVGSRALLLLDGFPMLSGDNGDIKSDAIPITLVEQVEVVKGAGSALYGASALGGVINIITREPNEKPYLTVNSYYGIYTEPRHDSWKFSDNHQSVYGMNFGYSQKIGNVGLSFAGSAVEDESYAKYKDEERYMLFGKANFALSGYTNLIFSGLAASNNRADWVYWQSLDSATRPPTNTDLKNRVHSNKFNLFTEIKHIISDRHFIAAKSGVYITTLENDLKGAEYRQSKATTFNTEFQSNYKFHDFFHLTSGLSHTYNKVEAELYGNQKQNTISLYTQMESPLGDLIFTYGGRLDVEKTDGISSDLDVGNVQFSPKVGMSYKTDFESTIRASIGRGFRPASVAERFASVTFQGFEVVPNLSLKPERSWSFEVGFNQPFRFFSNPMILDFAFYNNELFDMIEPKFVQGTRPSIQFLNTTRARITGIDASIKTLLFGKLGLEIGIAAMYPMDLDSNEILKYRSTISTITRLIYPIGKFDIFADYRFKSKAEKVDDELKLQIKDHDARVALNVLDLGVRYHLKPLVPINLTLNIYNIFDYYYTEVPGNLGKTRNIVFQISYEM